MKKNLLYLFALICSMGLFTACNNDDDKNEESVLAAEVVGTYGGSLDIVMVPEGGDETVIAKGLSKNVTISQVSNNEVKMELKDFSLTINEVLLPLGNIVIDKCAVTQSIEGYAFAGEQTLTFTGAGTVLGACNIRIAGVVVGNTMKLDIKVDVVSMKQKVNVSFNGTKLSSTGGTFYDFETWEKGVENLEPDMTFYEVAGGWSSSNTGAHFLKAFEMADKYVVSQTTDAHSGKSAAKIETIDSKGADMSFVKVPKVTTGTLFLGKFSTDIMNTLRSTKFGIEYHQKPVALKGFYKYTPGADFYRCKSIETCHETVIDTETTDQCMISAILYEVSTFEDPDFTEYLTGVDAYTSEKIVAIGQLKDGTAKASWTEFEVKLDYKKTFDPTKKYRFSIVCSSSKDGDNFNGAPGSVLTVDDFELVAEN